MGKKPPILYSPYAYNNEILLQPPFLLDSLKSKYAGRKVLLYMGTLTANYGLFDMLGSMEVLRKSRQDFVLLVMGEGRHKQQAVDHIAKNHLGDFVHLLGHVPEDHLASYFRLADAFLCPLQNTVQDWARCPSKLFMFLPFRKPIVTCRIGEAAELLQNDGFYFEPGNIQTLSIALERALLSAASGWQPSWNEHDHSWSARADQFLKWMKINWNI
jgi:glycosyltransferase involved in cell wall biosynthesis